MSILNRVKNWVAGDPYEEDMYQAMDDEYDYAPVVDTHQMEQDDMHQDKRRKNLKVVEHPSHNKAQVVVVEPRAFDEALEIIDNLRHRKSVILNLHLLDTAQSQRVVDFLSGATHAIDGSQQRIGDGVFLFTPSTVAITSTVKDEPMVPVVPQPYWANTSPAYMQR